jgi:hypothetical protein
VRRVQPNVRPLVERGFLTDERRHEASSVSKHHWPRATVAGDRSFEAAMTSSMAMPSRPTMATGARRIGRRHCWQSHGRWQRPSRITGATLRPLLRVSSLRRAGPVGRNSTDRPREKNDSRAVGITSRITSGALSDHAGAPSGACDVRRRVRVPQPLLRRPPATLHDARGVATA